MAQFFLALNNSLLSPRTAVCPFTYRTPWLRKLYSSVVHWSSSFGPHPRLLTLATHTAPAGAGGGREGGGGGPSASLVYESFQQPGNQLFLQDEL